MEQIDFANPVFRDYAIVASLMILLAVLTA